MKKKLVTGKIREKIAWLEFVFFLKEYQYSKQDPAQFTNKIAIAVGKAFDLKSTFL